MELKGSKTEKNLYAAFAGESQARNKYTYYASKAKNEGYEQIAAIFQETADQEKEHAKMWFKYVHGIDGTAENLVDAAAGEYEEWTDMYPTMAKEAREEGFGYIAELFEEKELAGRAFSVLHALEEPYKEVFMLSVFGGLSAVGYAGGFWRHAGGGNASAFQLRMRAGVLACVRRLDSRLFH